MAARKSRSKAKAARPTTVGAYLASLTPAKRTVIEEARAFVLTHVPKGYAEFMNWGVINWGIPLEEFSDTYTGPFAPTTPSRDLSFAWLQQRWFSSLVVGLRRYQASYRSPAS